MQATQTGTQVAELHKRRNIRTEELLETKGTLLEVETNTTFNRFDGKRFKSRLPKQH
jgi:hypothetical protein